jgi:hypothetical protein
MIRTMAVPKALAILALLLLASSAILPVLGGTSRGSRSMAYSTNFESGASGWTHGGAKDEWALGKPSNGPGYCHSGTHCWATTLNDTYAPEANEWLQSPSIDLQGAKSGSLDFWQYYDISDFLGIMVDRGFLEISNDGGSSYKPIRNFTGNSSQWSWEHVSVDLKDFLNTKILVRFRLVSDELFQAPGWVIDDLNVTVNGTGVTGHDLAVTGITPSPAAPNAGQDVSVQILVSDPGQFDEKGAKVTLSVQDPKDMSIIFTQSTQIDLITTGTTYKVNIIWRPSTSGLFILIGKVSIDGDIHPQNDTMSTRIKVGTYPHDVAIVSITEKPNGPKVGTQVTISVTVRNMGSSEEQKVPVHLQIASSTGTIAFEDHRPINDFMPNTTRTVDFTWTPTFPDLYIARAGVDLNGDPTMEDNRAELYILVARTGVDMGVVTVKVNPKDAAPGVRRTIVARVMEIGDVNATNVVVYYSVSDDRGVLFQGNTTYSYVTPGETKQASWDVYPDRPGVYTVTVQVKAAGDVEPNNDKATTTFTVYSAYQDVGVESLSVVPRDGASGIQRMVLAEVGNYGDVPEEFRTTVRITDPAGTQALTKDFDVNLKPAQRTNLSVGYTPTANGNYTATAIIYLAQDVQPGNDMMATSFIVSKPQPHDLGLESLQADPRTAFADVPRNLSAMVSNNGNTTEDGLVEFTVYDMNKVAKSYFNKSIKLDKGATVAVSGLFTPVVPGTYEVNVTVKITDGNIDTQPANDRINVTLIAEARPPAIDLSVDGIGIDPDPGVVGNAMTIIVLIDNLGVGTAEGLVNLVVTDPSSKTTNQSAKVSVGPRGTNQLTFKMTPAIAGEYTVKAHVGVTAGVDANTSNNDLTSKFKVVIIGIKDAAVTNLVASTKGGCGMTFDVRATVKDIGTVALGTVPVSLTVTGNGQTFNYDTTVTVPKNGSAEARFGFTAPKPGNYQFTVNAQAPGDAQGTNNIMSVSGEACNIKNTGTRVDTALSPWPFVIILIIVAVVGVIIYDHMQDKKRPRTMAPTTTVAPPVRRIPPPRPARPAQQLPRGPTRPRYGGQRPIR